MLFLAVAAAAVSLHTTDGQTVRASWLEARGAEKSAMVIVAAPSGIDAWNAVTLALESNGIASLTIAARASKDPDEIRPDVDAAVAWLREQKSVDPAHVILLGRDARALAALASAEEDPRIAGLAMLSAPVHLAQFDAQQALGQYGDRPVFLCIPKKDATLAKALLILDGSAKGAKAVLTIEEEKPGDAGLLWQRAAIAELVEWAKDSTAPAPVMVATTSASAVASETPHEENATAAATGNGVPLIALALVIPAFALAAWFVWSRLSRS